MAANIASPVNPDELRAHFLSGTTRRSFHVARIGTTRRCRRAGGRSRFPCRRASRRLRGRRCRRVCLRGLGVARRGGRGRLRRSGGRDSGIHVVSEFVVVRRQAQARSGWSWSFHKARLRARVPLDPMRSRSTSNNRLSPATATAMTRPARRLDPRPRRSDASELMSTRVAIVIVIAASRTGTTRGWVSFETTRRSVEGERFLRTRRSPAGANAMAVSGRSHRPTLF